MVGLRYYRSTRRLGQGQGQGQGQGLGLEGLGFKSKGRAPIRMISGMVEKNQRKDSSSVDTNHSIDFIWGS